MDRGDHRWGTGISLLALGPEAPSLGKAIEGARPHRPAHREVRNGLVFLMTAHFAKVPPRAARDPRLRAADHRVLIAISSHVNGEGRAYPSYACIASETGIARDNVPRSITRLEKFGYLRRQRHKRGPGLWDRSSYEIILKDSTTARGNGSAPPNGAFDDPEKSATGLNGSDAPTDHFEIFWRAYPTRDPHPNPKKPAAQKFAAALKRGIDPAVIIAGAQRYADYVARENKDPRYVKQAVTWLGQEEWNEAYRPAAKTRPSRARVGAI